MRRRITGALLLVVGMILISQILPINGSDDRKVIAGANNYVFLPHIQRNTQAIPNSVTFPEVNPLALGNCPASVHDRYATTGPDGQIYRTWHPIEVPLDPANPNGPSCHFAHEHGDPPHPSAPLPPFGYISYVNRSYGMIAAHQGYKVFTHYRGNRNGFGRPESDYGGLDIDFMATLHQGTSGRGRLSVQFHDFNFWSRDRQGRITQIYAMADTGNLISKCGPGGPEPARVVVCDADPTYEIWPFDVNVGGAWTSLGMLAAVTVPMNHIVGNPPCQGEGCPNIDLVSTSETHCGPDFGPCSQKLPFGHPASLWLGHMRTIHEPDWVWTNGGGQEYFCTDQFGNRQSCNLANSVQQRVARVNASNEAANILDRTPNAAGWDAVIGPLDNQGAPAGN